MTTEEYFGPAGENAATSPSALPRQIESLGRLTGAFEVRLLGIQCSDINFIDLGRASPLIPFVLHMAVFAPFRFFRVTFFSEILLRINREYELLSAFNTNQDFRFQTGIHLSPSPFNQLTSLLSSKLYGIESQDVTSLAFV